jgi:glycerophosphoryl diester phosphodiesterase
MMIRKGTLFLAMVIMLNLTSTFAQNNPVIAHRGAWKTDGLPQNSRAALKKAIALGCYGSEFDVVITKDNVLVVNHDNDFLGVDVATSTYKDLLKLRLKNGEKIPTVKEFIKIAKKQKNTKLIYELKPSKLGVDRTKEAARLSVELIKKYKVEHLTEFITFDYEAAKEFVRVYPEAKVSSLSPTNPERLKKDNLYGLDFHYSVYKKNPNYLDLARSLSLKTNVWTVNSPENLQESIDLGFDFITTDEPELLFQLWNKKAK